MTTLENDPGHSPAQTSTTEVVGRTDNFAEGEMKLARVGERRIAVIRTSSDIHALDNACPHQGYGLVTGSLEGEVLTCQWHNWKFRVDDGTCEIREENVPCHRVSIDDGEISVTVVDPTPEEARAQLWPSLERGFDKNYVGQMARDVARLLRSGADAGGIVGLGVERSQEREEYGVGHGLAMAADCLAIADLYDDDQKTLPLVQALAGLSEPTAFRQPWQLPRPDTTIDLPAAIEGEEFDDAMASTLGQLADGADMAMMRRQFIAAICQHHIAYGHGAIFTQKAFELLERIGWHRAPAVLPFLATSVTYGTREDTLPHMRKAMRRIAGSDLAAMAAAPDRHVTGWTDSDEALRRALLDSPEAAIEAAERAVLDGAGVAGLLDTVVLAVSERLLRYDLQTEFDNDRDFGWLDITHGLTYPNAARWAWDHEPSPNTARLALFAAFLCHDTGRSERWGWQEAATPSLTPSPGDVEAAAREGRVDDAVAHALHGDPTAISEALVRLSLEDRAASWIVAAHVIKLSQAARSKPSQPDRRCRSPQQRDFSGAEARALRGTDCGGGDRLRPHRHATQTLIADR